MNAWEQRLAIVSDEAAATFREAVSLCLPLGITAYEIRNLYEARVPFVSDEAIIEVLSQVSAHHLKLLGISPGFCKRSVDDPKTLEELTSGLPKVFRLMDRLDVRTMTVFGYRRTEEGLPFLPHVSELLGKYLDACKREGVELRLENSPSCWADTGEHLALLARAVGVSVTWDPANAAASGETAYPDGYLKVNDLVAHVHLKNWHPAEGHVYLRDGVVDIPGQLRALEADGYPGYYCIESHRWQDPDATQVNAQQLLAYLREIRGTSL